MLFVSNQKVKLRVLFDLNAQLIESFDRGITSEEVLWTRSKGNDLQVTNTDNGTCNWYEVSDHLCDVISCSNRIFRNISFQMTHFQVVGAVQHTAVSIATSVDHIAITLCCGYIHAWSVKSLSDQSLWSLWSEVSKENNKCITLSFVYILECLLHVFLILNSYWTFIKLTFVSVHDSCTSLLGKLNRETVTAYCD